MALFNGEAIMRSLVQAMGLTPEQVQAFVNDLVGELREMRADRLAFKPASAKAYQDVVKRLERIEDAIERVDDYVARLREILDPEYTMIRGEPEHEPVHRNGSAAGEREPSSG